MNQALNNAFIDDMDSNLTDVLNDILDNSSSHDLSHGVAIIGMAGRFPGAANVDQLWRNLCAGVESTTFFTDAELDPSLDPDLCADPNYVKARGIIDGAEWFDAAFFGIAPAEAEIMDPQARVFLELAHQALEHGGYTPESFPGLIGLYAGCGQNTYFERHLCNRTAIIERLGAFQTMLANEKDFLATRVAYKLNLTGPSLSVNTACSTSLVAVIQAFYSLLSYQCDMALAGGVSITTPQNSGYLYQEGNMLSSDGHCRPFDANAQGTMFNNGAGLVLLKRLEDAIADRDRIYAVIRGVGINNDGSSKVSFTAPSVVGQAEAIAMALAYADFSPDTISYVEAHGTATPLGDPIEIEALTQAFRRQTNAKQFCAIGSVKSNVGHLVAAAGVTGLIKTALALYHKQIPPSLNFTSPNPELDLANSPFYVNTELTDWPRRTVPRRAGVSSFGVGGTNAHVVLEEAPDLPASGPSRPCQLLILSAKTETALKQLAADLKTHLANHPNINLADVAYTLQQGRKAYNHRQFIICDSCSDAIQQLETPASQTTIRETPSHSPEVVMMFPGQGSQYVAMGQSLYQQEPVFRAAVDRCSELLKPLLARDLRDVLYSSQPSESAVLLQQTQFTQPALFTIEYALAQLWLSWGVKPAALIGHSIGEFVTACLAGVFSLEDGLKLVAVRGQMMASLPAGAMLSVQLSAEQVQQWFTSIGNNWANDLAIAAINGPHLCVVSGPTDVIQILQQTLEAEEIACKLLHTSHAFHSPMMEPVIEPFAALVRRISLSPPQIPFVSTVTADWITDEQALDPLYWASHLRKTVRFADGIQTLWQKPERILLEVGPRTTTATLARQQATDLKRQIAISSLGSTTADHTEWRALLQAVGQLWLAGVAIDWKAFSAQENRHRLPLPTYPFERQRYWIDPLPHRKRLAAKSTESISPTASDSRHHSVSLTTNVSQSLLVSPLQYLLISSMTDSPHPVLIDSLKEVLQRASGLDLLQVEPTLSFLEMGLDSLALTQVALALKQKFNVKITFRQLLEEYPNLSALANFILKMAPPERLPVALAETNSTDNSTEATTVKQPSSDWSAHAPMYNGNGAKTNNNSQNTNGNHGIPVSTHSPPDDLASSPIAALIAQQLQLMSRQLELLDQAAPRSIASVEPPSPSTGSTPNGTVTSPSATLTLSQLSQPTKPHGPGARIEKSVNATLSPEQRAALDRIIQRYIARTPESKRQAQHQRVYLADPRTVSGFTPLFKEMVYPIVVERSLGSKLWDVDGNEYIDITNGFGSNFFGWSSEFITEAIKAQLEQGIEIGPQTPLAGKVAQLITELTGQERVAFCNTGSEAVMAALRLARTVTGRNKIALFAEAYHGTFDEVVIRGGAQGQSLPAAPGILPSMVENALVLDYGSPKALDILRQRADELAAILVEPVQSRRPELQPIDFLRELRQLTEQSETALIMDEVVTGFRVHPGGVQKQFGIPADLATYGKVIGGGMPIGVVAGKAKFMDALDGGFWQFGDDSVPEVGVTYFAGTFVRHPLALAATAAVLTRLKEAGPDLQYGLAAKVEKFVIHLNQHFERVGAPIKLVHFSSLFGIKYPPEAVYGGLLYYLLREKGVHIWEHRPCFFSLAHTDADIEQVSRAFKDSVAEMQAAGFLPSPSAVPKWDLQQNNGKPSNCNLPPQPGARLGKDPEGNPAWFVPDPNRPGKYLQIETASKN